MARVSGLAVTPIKGMRLQNVEEIELAPGGARGDRRFFVVDQRQRMINGKTHGELQQVIATCEGDSLRLELPGGRRVEATVELGAPVRSRFFSGAIEGRLVHGPWAQALSEFLGVEVAVIDCGSGVDRGPDGAASLISVASLERLAQEAGEPGIDARRFRMLIEVEGIGAHEEDAWVGRTVRVGEAEIRFHGHVGRCLITSRDPDSGEIDLPTLDLLGAYRGGLPTTEPLPFGIYGEVVRAATVKLGDPVEPGNAVD
jgi:uncharacterized protein YcbX